METKNKIELQTKGIIELVEQMFNNSNVAYTEDDTQKAVNIMQNALQTEINRGTFNADHKKIKMNVKDLIKFYQSFDIVVAYWTPIFEGMESVSDTMHYLKKLQKEGIEYIM